MAVRKEKLFELNGRSVTFMELKEYIIGKAVCVNSKRVCLEYKDFLSYEVTTDGVTWYAITEMSYRSLKVIPDMTTIHAREVYLEKYIEKVKKSMQFNEKYDLNMAAQKLPKFDCKLLQLQEYVKLLMKYDYSKILPLFLE